LEGISRKFSKTTVFVEIKKNHPLEVTSELMNQLIILGYYNSPAE
jgi:hypothetical protein